MGFSFRNLFNDNAGGMAGGAAQGGGPLPPANDGGDRNGLPPQAAPGGGVSQMPTNGATPFDPQPTGRGSFEEMFAAGNRTAAEASGAAAMPFGAAPVAPAGPRAVYSVGDLLQFVPPALATREAISLEHQVEVELPLDGSHDVKLSTLYKSCPQLFATEITPLNDSQLTLPDATGTAAPAAVANPFGAPSISQQPHPQAQGEQPIPAVPVAQAGAADPAATPNPFDPNSGQHSAGAGAGAAPQPASMSPLSWHQPDPQATGGSPQAAQAPTQGGLPSAGGLNPFDPNPGPAPAQAPAPHAAQGPVPIPAEPIEVVPEPSNIDDASPFLAADDDAAGGAFGGGAADDMPSPFSLEEDNPFFLAEDDDDGDFGAMATQATDDAPSESGAVNPSAFSPPTGSGVPESPAQQPFEPAPPVQQSAPAPVAPAPQSSPAQVQGSVFAQPSAEPEATVAPTNPFAQASGQPAPAPAPTPEPAPAPAQLEPETPQATAPVESPWAAAVAAAAATSRTSTSEPQASGGETPVEAGPEQTPVAESAATAAAAAWGDNPVTEAAAPVEPAFKSDATDVPAQPGTPFSTSAMPNIEAPGAAAQAQAQPFAFAAIVPPTEADAKVGTGADTAAPENEVAEAFEPEAATPPPLPLSTAFAAAMPSSQPVEAPELAPEPEIKQAQSVAENAPAPPRKSIFGEAANEPASVPVEESPASPETIKLPLIELLGGRSPESLGFSPQSLPDGAEAELPMSRIEHQLSTGRVTVTLGDLAAASDREHGVILAQGNQAVEIDIPQNLLFHHLPDAPTLTEPVAEVAAPEEIAAEQPESAEPVNSLPPVQTAWPTAEQNDDAFAPAPADPLGDDLPPSGASVGFSTPFSSFAKDDEFLAGPPSTAAELPETKSLPETKPAQDSAEVDARDESREPASAAVDWTKSIPGPLKGFEPSPAAASDMIDIEQPANALKENLLVEPPVKRDPIEPADKFKAFEKPPLEKAGVPLFGGSDNDSDHDDSEAEGADDFAIDSESDDEVASFFTPSRPDSEELGVAGKRAVPDVDSLDTLPVLDEEDTDVDQGGGFFDELPPPAFSFEDELSQPVAKKSESVAADEVDEEDSSEAPVETEDELDEAVSDDRKAAGEDVDDDVRDEPLISETAPAPRPGAVTRGGADRVRDIELRAVFATTEEFTLQRIADLTLELCSGIDSCDVLARGRTVSASRRFGAVDGAEAANRGKRAKAMYRNVRDLADNAGLEQAEELTLHTETHAISFFTRGSACVTIHHERGDFRPGVREKLILVARGVAAFES